jgi:4-amino-4-deoxy-L-arabinose transferase-like glycosyltransferase
MTDEEKYVLDQAAKEVEHCRSWPTRVVAFFIAINFGVVAGLSALLNTNLRAQMPISMGGKYVLVLALLLLAVWVVGILIRNHRIYRKYRELQISVQSSVFPPAARDGLPPEWFTEAESSPFDSFWGYGLYVCMVLFVTLLTIAAVQGAINP